MEKQGHFKLPYAVRARFDSQPKAAKCWIDDGQAISSQELYTIPPYKVLTNTPSRS
jgi:hypothetical protein